MKALIRPAQHKGFAVILFTALMLLAASLVQAQEEPGEDFWEKYDDIADWLTLRLKLTPQQEDVALPILDQAFDEQLALLKEYGIRIGQRPELTVKQREELDAKMIAIRANTRAKLVNILNADQLQELKKIQREFHEDFRLKLAEE